MELGLSLFPKEWSDESFVESAKYFLNNYNEFAFFKNIELTIDNNFQERLLRSPVVGSETYPSEPKRVFFAVRVHLDHSKTHEEINWNFEKLLVSCQCDVIGHFWD